MEALAAVAAAAAAAAEAEVAEVAAALAALVEMPFLRVAEQITSRVWRDGMAAAAADQASEEQMEALSGDGGPSGGRPQVAAEVSTVKKTAGTCGGRRRGVS